MEQQNNKENNLSDNNEKKPKSFKFERPTPEKSQKIAKFVGIYCGIASLLYALIAWGNGYNDTAKSAVLTGVIFIILTYITTSNKTNLIKKYTESMDKKSKNILEKRDKNKNSS